MSKKRYITVSFHSKSPENYEYEIQRVKKALIKARKADINNCDNLEIDDVRIKIQNYEPC